MRIFLLPISTHRTLLYCDKALLGVASNRISTTPPSLLSGPISTLPDRVVHRANATWADWERVESGWKKYLTTQGNKAFRRIPYAEWGLKSLPPLHESTKATLLQQQSGTKKELGKRTGSQQNVNILYPPSFLRGHVKEILEKLATERQPLHKSRLGWSLIGLPITVPFALIPVVPNIPFFYLAFRAWSHYKALYGARYLHFLLDHELCKATPERALDGIYAATLLDREDPRKPRSTSVKGNSGGQDVMKELLQELERKTSDGNSEVMLLEKRSALLLADHYKIPELEIEVERAVEQVETAIAKAQAVKRDGSNG